MTGRAASTGGTFVALPAGPISLDAAARPLTRPAHGVVLVFSAVVRAESQGRRVLAVSWGAGEGAEETLRAIVEEARARFGEALQVALHHRVGRVPTGEACLVVVVAAPHRAEAEGASRHVMEQFRRRSPLWKQEHYADGDGPRLPGPAFRAPGPG